VDPAEIDTDDKRWVRQRDAQRTLDMIKAGDNILVNGGITGTNISARTIMDASTSDGKAR
jgi:preprotein translocase subunit YajC